LKLERVTGVWKRLDGVGGRLSVFVILSVAKEA